MSITKIQALEALAGAYETFSVEPIEHLLADDLVFVSQLSFVDLTSKGAYLFFMQEGMKAVKAGGKLPRTRIGYWGDEPCLAVIQDSDGSDAINETTRFVDVEGDKITRLSLCFIPGPSELYYP